MAKFEEVAEAFRNGAKIRATHWDEGSYFQYKDGYIIDSHNNDWGDFAFYKLLDNDWEIIEITGTKAISVYPEEGWYSCLKCGCDTIAKDYKYCPHCGEKIVEFIDSEISE